MCRNSTGSATLNIPFQAKVTDPDGQETLDRVFIAFENEDGSILTLHRIHQPIQEQA